MKIDRRNGVIGQTVFGEIFAAHGGIDHLDVLSPNDFFQTPTSRFVSSGLL